MPGLQGIRVLAGRVVITVLAVAISSSENPEDTPPRRTAMSWCFDGPNTQRCLPGSCQAPHGSLLRSQLRRGAMLQTAGNEKAAPSSVLDVAVPGAGKTEGAADS